MKTCRMEIESMGLVIGNNTLLDIVVKAASKTFLHSDTHPSFYVHLYLLMS